MKAIGVNLGPFPTLKTIMQHIKVGIPSFSLNKVGSCLHLDLTYSQQKLVPKAWSEVSVGGMFENTFPNIIGKIGDMPQEIQDIIYGYAMDEDSTYFKVNMELHNRICRNSEDYIQNSNMMSYLDPTSDGLCYLSAFSFQQRLHAARCLGAWPKLDEILTYQAYNNVHMKNFKLLKTAYPEFKSHMFHLTTEDISSLHTVPMYLMCRICGTDILDKNIRFTGECNCGTRVGSRNCYWDASDEILNGRVGASRSSSIMTTPEICGHIGNSCPELCDDWVSNVPGYCYLLAFEDRKAALEKMGLFPTFKDVMKEVYNQEKTPKFGLLFSGVEKFHMTLEDGLATEAFEILAMCKSCNKEKSFYTRVYDKPKVQCSSCRRELRIFIFPMMFYINFRIGETPRLANCFTQIDDLSTPHEHTIDGFVRRTLTVNRTEDVIEIMSNGSKFKDFRIHERSLKNMRHDYVSSEWEVDTDQPLSILGVPPPQGNLTPDYIDILTSNVVELGTINSNSPRALRSMYEGKILKYKDTVDSVKANLGVLVIGINRICTNLVISPEIQQVLISRFLEILPLENIIVHLCGFNIFKEESSDDYKLARVVFESMNFEPLESKDFNMSDISDFDTPITKDEEREAVKIFEIELKESRSMNKGSREDLVEYMSSFTSLNSRKDMKRICNFPMVLPSGTGSHITKVSGELPSSLLTVWRDACNHEIKNKFTLEEIVSRAKSNTHVVDHGGKKEGTFKSKFNSTEELELAKCGIGGKAYDSHPERLAHEAISKLSFHPTCRVDDIASWLHHDWLSVNDNPFCGETLNSSVRLSKAMSTAGVNQDSITIWDSLNKTKIISFSYFISYIFLELAMNYKQWTKPGTFIKRELNFGITLIIYNPKGHIFVSYAIPRSGEHLETGKIGPQLFDAGTHYISDFCSYNEPTIEHFIKTGPYMSSLLIHLKSSAEISPLSENQYVKDCISNILLMFLNNKTDCEELVTSQRYLTMKVLEDVNPNPWAFVSRLPKVMRSRLTAFYLMKTISIMEFYSKNRIMKVPHSNGDMILYDYKNIRSFFSATDISLSQKINEFYFGYVISKERGRGSDRMFKVLSKILEQEYEFRDSAPPMFSKGLSTPKFSSNKALLKVFSHRFKEILAAKMGTDFKDTLYNDFLMECSFTNFNKLATLKASSRSHPDNFTIPPDTIDASRAEIMKAIRESNPEEVKKRPKVMEALISMVALFNREKGRDPSHVIELLPWCLGKLLEKKCFDSDCFAKPQHGGDREIHVLEMSARIVQYHLELFSRVVCKRFPSETTCNPDTKDSFVRQHYSESRDILKDFQTHSKSADAQKWCQAHHTSHFAASMFVIAPPELRNFLMCALSLWPKKRLSFPIEMVTTMLINRKTEPVSKLYNRFRSDFVLGKGVFCEPLSNKIEIQSGMFQGILHTTSSLYHTMIQEVMKLMMQAVMTTKLHIQSHITIVQGSDDSGCMLSIRGPLSVEQMRIAKTMLAWKERVSSHLSVYWNDAKTTIGTHDLIEYNSEWHSRHKIIKPTFRWISACLELSVTERFIDRMRIFNNILTQCLEGGASTLECAVVQLNQCALHYMIMGFITQKTSAALWNELKEYPDPICGFFPTEFDVCAGVTGVEFQLYSMFRNTQYGTTLKNRLSSDVELSYIPEEAPNFQKVKDLQSVRLRFSNMKIYNSFINRLSITSYEDAIKEIDENPLLVFGRHTSWEEDQPNLVLKVFSPGVKESISNTSPMLRMAASSGYIQTTPCFSRTTSEDSRERQSLFSLINSLKESQISKPKASDVFPLLSEFKRVYNLVYEISSNKVMQDVVLKRTSKSKIIVFEAFGNEFSIMELAKRQWFGLGRVPLSSTQFRDKWLDTTKQYPFLSIMPGEAGLRDTCKNLNMSVIEVKLLLESMHYRTRSVVLHDSSSRAKSLPHTISRIYWPNVKLHYPQDSLTGIGKLRSDIFSTVSYWQSNREKEDLIGNMIKNSKSLNYAYKEIPSKGQRLKVFHDYLNGVSKSSILTRIISMKQGTLGTFITSQRGFGANRKGKGIWLGSICGVTTELTIEDRKCTNIQVSNFRDSVILSKSIYNLISEFYCTTADISSSSVLTSSGNFSFGGGKGTPVKVNDSLVFSYANHIEQWNWELSFSDFNLRLMVIDSTDQDIKKYTILSDSFSSKDWIEGTHPSTPDTGIVKWALGDAIEANAISSTVGKMIPSRRSDFLKVMKKMKEGGLHGSWNLEFFRLAIINSFKLQTLGSSSYKVQANEAENDETYMDLYKNVMMMDLDDDDIQDEITNWAEEAERIGEGVLHSVDDSEISDLGDIIKLLQYGQSDEPYLDESNQSRTMPYSIKFFSFLNSLASAHYNLSFTEVYEKAKNDEMFTLPGLLGKIISLVLRRYHISTDIDDSSQVAELDLTATVLSESITSRERVTQLDIKDIQGKIELIDTLLHDASPGEKLSLTRTKEKYMRLSDLKANELKDPSMEINYNDLLKEICKVVVDNRLKFYNQFPTMELLWPTILETLLCTDENQFYVSLSSLEKSKIQSSIQSKVVNIELVNLMQRTFDIEVEINEDGVKPTQFTIINSDTLPE